MTKLKIDLPEERVKTVFKLKQSQHSMLAKYAIYLSDLYKKKISENVIIDSVLENLSKDKDFKKFCTTHNEKI